MKKNLLFISGLICIVIIISSLYWGPNFVNQITNNRKETNLRLQPTLNSNDYTKIESIGFNYINEIKGKDMNELISLLDSCYMYRENPPYDAVNDSPNYGFIFLRKDGTEDRIELYGQYSDYTINSNDIRYTIQDVEKVYSQLRQYDEARKYRNAAN